MKATFIAASLFTSVAFSAVVDISSIPRGSSKNFVHGAYMVELDRNSVGVDAITGKRSATPHADFYASLHKRGINWDIRNEFDDDIWFGASLSLHKEDDILQLANTNGVVSVTPITILPPPQLAKQYVVTSPDDVNLPVDTYSTHVMTGVDKIHAEGYFGQGVKIGIIDSGFDYTHPALGGGFGPGYKFASGWDFVGDNYNGSNIAVPDSDPQDCQGHGSHVAGIIGANENPYNFTGVVSKAELAGYRVFGCHGGVADDVLVAAITRAYQEGCDIITMSLGGVSGWTASVSSVVSSRVAKQGRIVTIAAGNDGQFGAFYASGPGTGIDVVTVGSVDNTEIPIQRAKVTGYSDVTYYSLFPLNFTETLPVWATNSSLVADDACSPLPSSTPDLSQYVVLIRRGTCTFVSKLANVAAKGARVALIYNNGGTPTAFDADPIPAALISAEDGAYLLNQIKAGTPPKVSFPQTGGAGSVKNPTGGLMSTFSSYGPTFDAFLKPAISAPGGGILSSIPLDQGGYAIFSGTSMATPFVAGVSALLLQIKGQTIEVARGARDRFQTTASLIPQSYNESALINSAVLQGAGLINAYNMIHYATVVTPGQLLLNDTANHVRHHIIEISNTGDKSQSYTLSHKAAGTLQTHPLNTTEAYLGPVPLTTDKASVSVSSNQFTVAAGQSKKIDVWIDAPKIAPTTIPVYSGFIEVTSSTGELLRVTYMGIASSLKDAQILDTSTAFFGEPLPALVNGTGDVTTTEQAYTFVGEDYPSVLIRLLMGSRTVVFDLVDASLNLDSLVGKRDVTSRGFLRNLFDWLKDWLNGDGTSGTYGEVPIVGGLATYDWNPRNAQSPDPDVGYSQFSLQNNTFANATVIPNGRYKILLRTLKITGDLNNEDDYETWLSPVVVYNATLHR